ncbi:hypothetical protein EXS65_02265 [Candidatus Peribacteria bacterium]|nr:hypothetical protein [Candidatus Peribacteria bacterium]
MRTRLLSIAVLVLFPFFTEAAPLVVNTGVDSSVPTILQGIVNVLLSWSGLAATGLFLLGSILMVGSGGEEAFLSAGKKIMKAALIGFALILASWLLLSTVIYFISL